MEDLQKEAMNILLQLQKLKPELFDNYMNEPINEVTLEKMKKDLIQITSTTTSSPSTIINYYYEDIIENFAIDEEYYSEKLTKDNVVEKMMKYVEEKIEEDSNV